MILTPGLIQAKTGPLNRGIAVSEEPLLPDVHKFLASFDTGSELVTLFEVGGSAPILGKRFSGSPILKLKDEVLVIAPYPYKARGMPYVGYIDLQASPKTIQYRAPVSGMLSMLIPLVWFMFIPWVLVIFLLMAFSAYRNFRHHRTQIDRFLLHVYHTHDKPVWESNITHRWEP